MDPLEEARIQGIEAALHLLEDASKNRDLPELVAQIRTAAANDSKYNHHLIEAIASFSVIGWEKDQLD